MEIEILEQNPISNSELKEKLEQSKKETNELNFRSNKILEHLTEIQPMKLKDYQEKFNKINELEISRLRARHIVKVIEINPESLDELKMLLSGESLTLKQDDLQKIQEIVTG